MFDQRINNSSMYDPFKARRRRGGLRRTVPSRNLNKGYTGPVTYTSGNHISVMTQMYGSVWPRVFPFCVTNTILAGFIWLVDKKYDTIDCSIDPSGHKYLATLVSFLVIARLQQIYGYSIRAREQLNVLNKNAHELVEVAYVISCHDTSRAAKEWRRSVALGTIELLRDCMDAICYNSELDSATKLTLSQKTLRTEYFRRPALVALALRKKVLSHRYTIGIEHLIDFKVEDLLLQYVDNCQNAFYSIRKLIHTPIPLPLVQMARTINLVWVYTLPFALQHTPYPLWGVCMLIFLLTYGFMGLESVCIEMSDPFGDDANDFDQVNLAYITFENIYMTIFRYDINEVEVSKVRQKAIMMLDESPFFSKA